MSCKVVHEMAVLVPVLSLVPISSVSFLSFWRGGNMVTTTWLEHLLSSDWRGSVVGKQSQICGWSPWRYALNRSAENKLRCSSHYLQKSFKNWMKRKEILSIVFVVMIQRGGRWAVQDSWGERRPGANYIGDGRHALPQYGSAGSPGREGERGVGGPKRSIFEVRHWGEEKPLSEILGSFFCCVRLFTVFRCKASCLHQQILLQ